jgi:hypothetical protein
MLPTFTDKGCEYVADGRSTPGPGQKNEVAVDIWKKNSKQEKENT